MLKYIELLIQDINNAKIPKTVENIVWRQYFNDKIIGKCYCCKITIDNLRPICGLCSSSISNSKMNMNEFITKYGLDN